MSSQFEDGVVSVCGRCRLRLRAVSSQIEAIRVPSWLKNEDRGGSRRVEEGRGRTSPVDDHRKCFSCLSINACACDYCICVRVPASMLLYTRRPSSTSYTHTAHCFEQPSTRTAKSKLVSLVDVLKISSTESRFFSLSNVFSMEFAHGDCAFDKHNRLSGHTRMIL